jgi:hypothetical protein
MSLALQNGPGNALLHGPIVVAASGGVAVFTGVIIDTAGIGYTLATASANLTPASSKSITVKGTTTHGPRATSMDGFDPPA